MKNFSKIILAFFGFLLITSGIITSIILTNKSTVYEIKASAGQDPKEVEITNITDDSFTVSYLTTDQIFGTINYGNSVKNLDSIALDDRDQLNQTINRYYTHSITIRDLSPLYIYYFEIISGDKRYNKDSLPYKVATGSKITQNPPNQNPISGEIILPNGTTPKEGLVYAKTDGSQKISSLIENNGTYILPLNSLRDSEFKNYFILNPHKIIFIKAKTSTKYSSIDTPYNKINPVPLITLSNNYDSLAKPPVSPTSPIQNNIQNFPKEITTLEPTASEIPKSASPNPSSKKNILNIFISIKSIFIK